MTYKLTRRTARSDRGWHWCIDATADGRRSNFSCSRPFRWRWQALIDLYFGAGWDRWTKAHLVYADMERIL